jgi:PIN domain nuclease of toxin-antitoxin system
MRLLLDTMAWLWWITDHRELSERARSALADRGNEIFVSAASVWEVAAKHGRHVQFGPPPTRFIESVLREDGFHVLPVELGTILQIWRLNARQEDMFDQLLIGQATTRGLTIVTTERYKFDRYRIDVIPARDQGSR